MLVALPLLAGAHGDAAQGQQKSTDCSSCHGEDGNSAMPGFPKLASQHAHYLIRQLKDFKAGKRHGPMMESFAAGLSEEDMADLAAFYHLQPISKNEMPIISSADEDEDEDETSNENEADNKAQVRKLLAKGKILYKNGNAKSKIAACTACHGPNGEGNKPASFPVIAGQHADYLIKTLTDFQQGTRHTPPDAMMHPIARKMTAEEIQAVSFYLSMKKN